MGEVEKRYGFKPELDIYVSDAWAHVPEDTAVVRAIDEGHKQVFGTPAERVVFSWSSDANVLTRNGVVAVNYGPSGGPGKEMRGTLYIPNLIACTKVYAIAATYLCSMERKKAKREFTVKYGGA